MKTQFITKDNKVIPIRDKNSSGLNSSQLGLALKRRVNRTKRVKLNSQGFKVKKNIKFYIAKGTTGSEYGARKPKPAFNPELVEIFKDMWNHDPSFKLLRKHVKDYSMVYSFNPKYAGTWDSEKKKVKLWDYPNITKPYFKHTVVHELIGHAFWDIARKWRRESLVEFNKVATASPPINEYVKKNETQWRKENSENWKGATTGITNLTGHETMTTYANEQHSAITELIYDDKVAGHRTLIDDVNRKKLTEAWKKLHY